MNHLKYTSHQPHFDTQQSSSPPASLPFKGQVTERTTCKWSIPTKVIQETLLKIDPQFEC